MVERIFGGLIDSNVYIISQKNSCIIIDAGVPVENIIKKIGDKKVEAIFLTHGHYDHCYYVGDYIKCFECKVFCLKETKEYLQNSEKNYSDGKFQIDDFSNFVFCNDDGEIKLPNFNVKYHKLGGHSRGDMCYQIEEDIFVGDVVIGREIGRMDLYGGDKFDMIQSLEYLIKKDYKVMYSGHGNENLKNDQDKNLKIWLRYLKRKIVKIY